VSECAEICYICHWPVTLSSGIVVVSRNVVAFERATTSEKNDLELALTITSITVCNVSYVAPDQGARP
jgi:hypothetical protein